jgi:hypothetical protein
MLYEPLIVALVRAMSAVSALAQGGEYGFWAPLISALQGIGLAASGVGLVVAILIKGAAGQNSERHGLAATLAERVFAGLFVILLGTIIYGRIVEWTGG